MQLLEFDYKTFLLQPKSQMEVRKKKERELENSPCLFHSVNFLPQGTVM